MMSRSKRIKNLIKNSASSPTFGTNPMDPWSAKAGLAESNLLDRFLKARGINPKFVPVSTKVSHAKSNEFKKWAMDHRTEEVQFEQSGKTAERAHELESRVRKHKEVKTPPGSLHTVRKEEVEQVDELSRGLLNRYKKAAEKQVADKMSQFDKKHPVRYRKGTHVVPGIGRFRNTAPPTPYSNDIYDLKRKRDSGSHMATQKLSRYSQQVKIKANNEPTLSVKPKRKNTEYEKELAALKKKHNIKEEFGQIDEGQSRSEYTAHRWLINYNKEKKPGFYVLDKHNNRMHDEPHSTFEKALKWHRDQPGHKFGHDFANGERIQHIKEDVYQDPQAATQTVFDGANNTNDVSERMSRSARIIKSIYKKRRMSEDTYDWEKADKSVATYGKKPKMDTTDDKENMGENKPKAAAVVSGGTTLTGQKRDTIEIDPMMRLRPGQPDPTKSKDGDKEKKEGKKDK